MPQSRNRPEAPAFAEGGGLTVAGGRTGAALFHGPWPALLPVSLAAWAVLIAGGEWLFLPAYCGSAAFQGTGALVGVEPVLRLNPPAGLAAGWLAMLAATMLPLLAAPIVHVGRIRPRAVGLFLFGYVAVWMAAGAVLLLHAIVLGSLAGGGGPAGLLAAAAIALLWQASPWKQACLNRCHGLPELPRSGIAAGREALRFGLGHGLRCAGACWALMALPLAAGGGHLAAMGLVALFLFAERLEPPRPAQWRLRWPRAGFGAALAMARPQRRSPAGAGGGLSGARET